MPISGTDLPLQSERERERERERLSLGRLVGQIVRQCSPKRDCQPNAYSSPLRLLANKNNHLVGWFTLLNCEVWYVCASDSAPDHRPSQSGSRALACPSLSAFFSGWTKVRPHALRQETSLNRSKRAAFRSSNFLMVVLNFGQFSRARHTTEREASKSLNWRANAKSLPSVNRLSVSKDFTVHFFNTKINLFINFRFNSI